MQRIPKDYLERRFSKPAPNDSLPRIQEILNTLYPQKAKAISLQKGVLKIITPSAAVANDLRLRQERITIQTPEITRFQIRITS